MRSLIATWAAFLAAVVTSAIHAQQPQTVQVKAGPAQGSGVICGSSPDGSLRAVMTVAHVVGSRQRVIIGVTNGHRYQGRVIAADPRTDAALVVIPGRYLEKIPNARLHTGPIDTTDRLRTEGFISGRYAHSLGRPLGLRSQAHLEWSGPSRPGMSGGPTYLVGQEPVYLTCTTASDFHTLSLGPYRTHLAKWIPTCSGPELGFSMSGSGEVQIRRIEGPLIDRSAPSAPPKPEPTPARAAADQAQATSPDNKPSIDELRDLVAQALAAQQKQAANQPAPTPRIKHGNAVTANGGDVLEVPITLLIRRSDSFSVELKPQE